MDKSTFIKDQRETVLSAIQRVHPSFAPVYTPPQLGYSNKLLDFMNENIQSIELKPNELVSVKRFFFFEILATLIFTRS